MAIIIPSSKIYSINNSKVRNNVIERIELSANAPSLKNEYNTQVYGKEINTKDLWERPSFVIDSNTYRDLLSDYNNHQVSSHYSKSNFVSIKAIGAGFYSKYKSLHFSIPKFKDGILIDKIRDGQSENANNIKTKITYDYSTWDAMPTIKLKSGIDTSLQSQFDIYEMKSLSARNEKYHGTKTAELLEQPTLFKVEPYLEGQSTLFVSFREDETDVSTAKISYNEAKDAYEIDINILCAISIFKVAFGENIVLTDGVPTKCDYYSTTSVWETLPANTNIEAKGIVEDYKPLLLNVDFYGNTIELNLKDEILYINGETAKKVYSVERNELMQTTNYRGANASLVEDFSKTQELYAKGKETATVRCSIGDYYDTENGLTITPKTDSKMTFDIGDKVVPMVRNSEGGDNALSSYSNGTAKVFNVVGEKYIYDGAVWQELTLRETGEGLYIYQTENPYLTFSSETDFTLSVYNQNKGWNGVLEYSTNARDWAVWNAETISSVNGKLYVRGLGNTKIGAGTFNVNNWILSGTDIYCDGNIETLLDYKAVKNNIHPQMDAYCFGWIFAKNTSLITPPALPSTNLAAYCYYAMFSGCENLIALPNLPATKIVAGCYDYMFQKCYKIAISETQTSGYNKPYRIPVVGNGVSTGTSNVNGMFTLTGGTFKNNPEINTTYYTSNELV